MVGGWRQGLRVAGALLGYVVVAGVIALPVAAEQAVERARFDERLGTFPVQVRLAHNGVSSVDTGLLGKVYWERTGAGGFGADLRSTGPPEAGGTLTSYVTPEFLQANAAFLEEPGEVARVYGEELRSRVLGSLLRFELVAGGVGGLLLFVLFRGSLPAVPRRVGSRWLRSGIRAGYLAGTVGVSLLLAANLFGRWEGRADVGQTYPMPGIDGLSFSSPQTREVAQQIQPFIEKNTARIEERAREYEDAAVAALEAELPLHVDGLEPLDGERVVLSEADPQGSRVATRVRRQLYEMLTEQLGRGAVVLRTISGDVTSNGAVAEKRFVAAESAASPEVPSVAVKGDHDSAETVAQLESNDVAVPDLEVVEAGGLSVAGAADPAFKALFGGLVENPSGVSEEETGRRLREVVDEHLDDLDDDAQRAVQVLVHQPRAAAGYLELDSTGDLDASAGRETTPYDDGIDDVPAGTLAIGHLHDASGPWVIWNTDGDEVTWTVVSQLGTSGGVEENPTFNRFSTPFSVPLKDVSVRLSYVNPETGLQTGYASIVIDTRGAVTVEERVDVGLPGGEPVPADELGFAGPDPAAARVGVTDGQ